MSESVMPHDSTRNSLSKISTLGFLIFALWTTGVGGILVLVWGDTKGLLAVAAGLALAALYPTARFQRYIASLGASPNFPARVFIANAFLIGLAAFFGYGFATDPFVAYNNRDMLTLVHFVIAEAIAIGALAANVVAYRKDRQRIGRT